MDFDFRRRDEIGKALLSRGREQERLFARARRVRDDVFQGRVEVRSVMEYANVCRQSCLFCGIRRNSSLRRYVLDYGESLNRVRHIYNKGRRVFVISTGESDSDRYFLRLFAFLKEAKTRYPDLTVMCGLGNLTWEKYRRLRDIGIERYLLKFETSDSGLYRTIKPTDSLKTRLAHISMLKRMGFHVSSGNITGLPGQTIDGLIDDLLLLKELDIPMGSTSVFIPNDLSPYRHASAGSIERALNFTAILRILCPTMLIPTTSSLTLLKGEGQYDGLMAGANTVTIHDATPRGDEGEFVIYKTDRYKPRETILNVITKAGMTPSMPSLIRVDERDSLFHRLVGRHMNRNRVAVRADGCSYRYRDLERLTSRFCSFLRAKNVREGDVVLLAVHDSIEFIVAFLSCVRLGAVVGPIDPRLTAEEWKGILSSVSPRCVLAVGSLCGKFDDKRFVKISDDRSPAFFHALLRGYPPYRVDVSLDGNNPALLLFTSGTTGRPKGVLHARKDLCVDAYPRTVLKMTERDVVFSCSRLHTSYGLGNSLLFPLLSGSSVILSRDIPRPTTIREILRRKPTLFFAVPSQYDILPDYADSLKDLMKGVRCFVSAGEKLYDDIRRRWRSAYGKDLLECYGSTEMCHPFVSNMPGRGRAGSCGKVLDGFEIRLSGGGRMFCRGPSLFSMYWNDPVMTRKKLVNGWFRSGDIVSRDREGYLYIKGRESLVVKVHGKWCSIPDVENVIRSIPIVREAAVLPGEKGLDSIVALRHPTDATGAEREIRRHCIERLPLHEVPRNIRIVESLPKTRSGKIDRKRLGSSESEQPRENRQ